MSNMTKLNYVELVEKNPIERLSTIHQSRLVTKIKNTFISDHQQLFVASFYAYLNYNPNADFVIDLDSVWKWLGFQQKYNAKRLLERYFKENIDYKNLLLRTEEQDSDEKKHGGHNKEIFMLTINAFKRLCLKADTKKADQIHEYYIKLEETLHQVVNEESNELRLQLEQVKNTMVKTEEKSKKTIEQLTKEKELTQQTVILKQYANSGPLVYIVKVKTFETGEYVVKIGESRRGIEARFNEHKTKYAEVLLLDCFSVKRSKDFEYFLHNHTEIRLNRVTDLPGHETEKELFLIGKTLSYGVLINIIKTNVGQFNEIDYQNIKDDIELIKNILSNQHQQQIVSETDTIKQLMESQTLLINKVISLEKFNKEILDRLNSLQTRTTTHFETPLPTVGPRLQKISPDTLQIVKVYESVSECMREDIKFKRPSIHKAIQENTIYNGFRWMYIDRELDPRTIVNLQPTKQTRLQNLGYIAKLDSNKTKIINVYIDRKTAAIKNGYSNSGLDAPVRSGNITNGHYYVLYDRCDDNLKASFESQIGGEPILYKDGVGQYDSQQNLLKEFICKYDVIKTLSMSDKTLAKALDKDVAYNGFYYKSIGSKTQAL